MRRVTKKIKTISKSVWHKRAWKVFSKWVRRVGVVEYLPCFTCGKIYPVKELDAGHFLHGKLDFDPINIQPQCTRCNRFLHGNLWEYGKRLTALYGEKAIDQLEGRAKVRGNYYTITELQIIIKQYS